MNIRGKCYARRMCLFFITSISTDLLAAYHENIVAAPLQYVLNVLDVSVNSILVKYKYIMIQTIFIHKTLHLKGDTGINPRFV